MATAEQLLAGSVDKTLVIDSDLRTIKIPPSITNIGVESDDEVTRLQFRMPRYYNDFDLSEFRVRINYLNAKQEPDVYAVTDATTTNDTITFSWLVGRFATMYKGNVTFIVCLKKLTNEGVIDQEFNTTVAILPVLVGLETEEAAVEGQTDIIAAAAYETILLGLSNGLKGDSPVKGVDYYTADERAEFAEEVANAVRGVYANAYKQSVSGEVIRVDDVSPLEHTVDVRVHGKNFIDPSTIHIARYGKNIAVASNIGDVFTYDSTTDRYTISGTGDRSIYTLPVPIPKGTTCTITVDCISGIISNKSSNSAIIGGYHTSDSGSSWQVMVSFPTGESVNLAGTKLTNTITISETVTDIYFFFYASTVTIISPIVCRIQFEIGEKTTDYVVHQEAQIYTPNTDGTVENVYSLDPTMTLFTDTNDTIIDLTYSRDNNKVIGDISKALDTLIAMQEDTITLLDNMSGGTS